MGINSIHQNNGDMATCFNKTNETYFKATILKRNFDSMQVIQGIEKSIVKCVIVVHGNCDVNVKDIIEIPSLNNPLKVINTSADLDSKLFRKRCDYDDFTGLMEIALG